MSSNLVESDTRFREYFKKYRQTKTVNTIPYSDKLPQKDSAGTSGKCVLFSLRNVFANILASPMLQILRSVTSTPKR